MLSRTKIKSRVRKKTNPELVETIRLALKNPAWDQVARYLSSSTRNYSSVNLNEIDEQTKEGDTVLIVGKVLSQGNVTKKIRIISLSISAEASEKIKESKSEYVTIEEEIKSNPKFQGVKIIK